MHIIFFKFLSVIFVKPVFIFMPLNVQCFVTQLFNIICMCLFISFSFFFFVLYCRWYWSHSRYRMGLHVTMWPDDDGSMSHCPPSRERCVYLFSVLVFFFLFFLSSKGSELSRREIFAEKIISQFIFLICDEWFSG